MIGYAALGVSLFLTIVSVFFYLYSFFIQNNKSSTKELKEMRGMADKGRIAYILSAAGIAVAAVFLMAVILTDRFEYAYVTGYSSRDLPFAYKFAAFWAGQEGSFLLWLFFQAVFGLVMLKERAQAGAMAVYGLLQAGLLSLLIYKSPFMMLLEARPDGLGLNPLLQDPWMVIHPPVLFLGYAGLAVPFAYVLENIISKTKTNPLNLNNILQWSLFSFAALGAGMFIGGYWAYKVLGWGGYWAWDPVENSSLVPWLAAGAFIHLLVLARVRPAALKPCYAAAIFSLLLVLYGTYLTRSGILSDFSTHSFANEGIGGYLGLFTLLVAVCSFLILIFKWQSLPDGDIYPSLASREFLLAFAALLLAVLGVLVFVGMSVPLVTMSFGNPNSVGASFYNSTSLPVALVISVLLAFAPLVKWNGNGNQIKKPLVFIFILPGIALALFLELWNPFYVLIAGFSFLALSTNLHSVYSRSISKAAALSHIGTAILLIGIIVSSAAAKTETVSFEAGKPVSIFTKQITYLGTEESPDGKGFYQNFAMRDMDGSSERLLQPLTKLNKKNAPAAREPGIYRSVWEDIYIAPVHNHDDDDFGEEITLSKAQPPVQFKEDISLKFNEFKMFGSDTGGMIFEALLEVVETSSGQTEKINLQLTNKGGDITGTAATVFGRYEITLVGVNPRENKVIAGVKDANLSQIETLKADIVTKPLINLVWLGAIMITAGGVLGTVRK